MIFNDADRSFARDLFARVRELTSSPDGGVTRESYGPGETLALRAVSEAATERGLGAWTDFLGNLIVTDGDTWPEHAVVVGSHLDSVPNGGNYDGLAGVVAGLLVAHKAKQRGSWPRPVVALGLRGEESAWFGVPYIGSKALLGKLPKSALSRTRRGDARTLAEHLGWPAAEVVTLGERSAPTIAEFWELHIEQGPILDDEKTSVGLVTGIRGNVRAPSAWVIGEPGHSGTTPHRLRKDAVVRFAGLINELEDRRESLLRSVGTDLIVTCGVVSTDPTSSSLTTIAGRVDFTLDIRSMSNDEAQGFLEYAQRYAGDQVEWGEIVRTPSEWLDKELLARSGAAAKRLGVPALAMPSGAGHDAAVFSQAGIPSGMIFVRNQHGSHNPHEAMDMDDFMLGVEVLWETIR